MCDIKNSFEASPDPVQKPEALHTHTQRMNVMLKFKLKYNSICCGYKNFTCKVSTNQHYQTILMKSTMIN